MIVGSGVDIVEVGRMRKAIKRQGELFLNKVFTQEEIDYSFRKKSAPQHLAARFAAKEAVFKAFGGNGKNIIWWKDIEVVNNKNGKPVVKLYGGALLERRRRKIKQIIISISHTKNYAVANAVLVSAR